MNTRSSSRKTDGGITRQTGSENAGRTAAGALLDVSRMSSVIRASRSQDPGLRHGNDESTAGVHEIAVPADDRNCKPPRQHHHVVRLPLEQRRRRQHWQVMTRIIKVMLPRVVVNDKRQI